MIAPSAPPTKPASLRIVLAEDNAMVAILLAEVLAGFGHELCSIETTEAGVVMAAMVHQPDMLIVDANLAVGSGVVAVEAILRKGYIPYVLMSGGPIPDAPLGAVVIDKPFFDFDLIAAIERAAAGASPDLAFS